MIILSEKTDSTARQDLFERINTGMEQLVQIEVIKGAYAGELLLFPLQTEAVKNTLRELYEDTYIVSSQLGKDAAALGAASLIMDEAFNLNNVKIEDYV